MSKPDFIGIGAMKAGTTWLYQCLLEHPAIYMPEKEIGFFSHDKVWNKGFDWYEKKIESSKKITGEFTVFYLDHPDAPLRIHNQYPETKLIICLRNPMDRSFSHYLHGIRYNFIDRSLTFSEAVKQHPYLIKNSCYSLFLQNYLRYFSSQQLLILIYEDSLKDPLHYVQSVYKFLNADSQFVPPSLNTKIHISYKPRFNLLEKFLYQPMFSKLRRYWLGKKIGRFINRLLYKINNEKALALTTNEKNRLKEYFQPEIQKIEQIINRSLSEWS